MSSVRPGEGQAGTTSHGPSRVDTLPDGFAELLQRSKPKPGDVVGGRYQLEEQLGAGAMGYVFRARNLAIGLQVAIKVLKPDLLANPDFRRRFQKEAEAVAAVNHPNVVRFLDLVVGDPTFLVMEHVAGETLSAILKRELKLEVRRAVELGIRLCWGLDAAHAAGVIHRDLKPSNVLVLRDRERGEQPKLIDFGLAKTIATPEDKLTRTGQVVGTPHYMSPEQISSSSPVDGRSDVYALGCVLYELVTGKAPFVGSEDEMQILYRQMHEKPQAPSIANPEVTPALDQVILRALAKAPEDRYGGAAELARALVPTVEKRATPEVAEPRSGTLVVRPRRSRATIAASIGIGLVLGAAAMLVVGRLGGGRARGGLLLIATEPAGAKVIVDGKPVGDPTPTYVAGLGPGAHQLRLEREGRQPLDRAITLGAGERQSLDITLAEATRKITVETNPLGAQLFVDGKIQPGETPIEISLAADDFHELRAERLGYETALRALKPEDTSTKVLLEMRVEVEPRGNLLVVSDDLAEVYIDGIATGFETPTNAIRVAAGEHKVELRDLSGVRGPSRIVTVKQGETIRVSMTIK
jgi:predicted Ser/Thr protein kinase